MSTQVILNISDDIYHKAKRIAQLRQKDVADILAESIILTDSELETAVPSELDTAIKEESAAYLLMHSMLVEKYLGEHVAIFQGDQSDLQRSDRQL